MSRTAAGGDSSAHWALRGLQGTPVFVRELVAGGIAGGIAKSSVAPLERTKILFQTGRIQPGHGVWQTLNDIANKEGWQGLLKGNTATVTRIIPYSAIHFWAYEQFRRTLFAEAESRNLQTGPWLDLLAGSAAGASAVAITYPLDLVRTRMAWQLEVPLPSASTAAGAAAQKGGAAGRTAAAGGDTAANSSSSRVQKQPVGSRGLCTSSGGGSRAIGAPDPPLAAASRHRPAAPRLVPQPQTSPPTAAAAAAAAAMRNGGVLRRAVQTSSSSSGSVASQQQQITMASTAMGVLMHEGVSGLYKGVMPTLWGILPYAGIKFYVYQSLKQRYRHMAVNAPGTSEGGAAAPLRLPVPLMLAFGAFSGLVGQTLTYPLDIVRRRMQVQGAGGPGPVVPPGQPVYTTTLGCLLGMWRQEGLRSLFYGLHINYIKVVPSTALGFMIYDYMKSLLLLPNHL